jgi:hypothetical protein
MGMSAILCTLSPKRRALIEEEPSVLGELLAARHEGEVRGLLDLDTTWDALDRLLSRRANDAVLGDAVVARTGAKMRARAAFGPARLLEKARVAEIAAALAALPDDVVAERYDELYGGDVHGGFGQERVAPGDTKWLREKVTKARASEIEILRRAFIELRAFYAEAAKAKHDVMSIIV